MFGQLTDFTRAHLKTILLYWIPVWPSTCIGIISCLMFSTLLQTSATRRKYTKIPKTQISDINSGSKISTYSKASGHMENLSSISCECHQTAGRRRCSASPELSGREGKENELSSQLELDSCRLFGVQDKRDSEDMDCEEMSKSIFPDDDSNQILPVEQFFGNLDTVQDFPQRTTATSSRVHKERRRRHYYARDDSDEGEEQCFCSAPQDEKVSTL